MKHIIVVAILDYLNSRGTLNNVEKDLYTSVRIYTEAPFNTNEALRQISENCDRYPGLTDTVQIVYEYSGECGFGGSYDNVQNSLFAWIRGLLNLSRAQEDPAY